jgi:hypothetical protein
MHIQKCVLKQEDLYHGEICRDKNKSQTYDCHLWDFILNATDDPVHVKTMINLAQIMGKYLHVM